MAISVVNKYKHQPTREDIKISRPGPLGNPFTHKPLGTSALYIVPTLEEALVRYEAYLREKISQGDEAVLRELSKIKKMGKVGDVYLVCTCHPRPCHGNVIVKLLNELED